MNYSIKQYNSLKGFKYPIVLKSGFTITELKGECANCGKELCNLRGEIVEHKNCSDIKFAGICEPCKLLVSCQMRHYEDGRVMQNARNGWENMIMDRVSIFEKIKKRLKRLFR